MSPTPVRIPGRFEAVVRMANGQELRSLVVEVRDALALIDAIDQEMLSTGRGRLLVLQGATGSGKTTFLNTVHLFREGVASVGIESRESIPAALETLGPVHGRLRIAVVKDRESLARTTPDVLEEAVHAINQFTRSRDGERTLVAWPCTTPDMAEQVARLAGRIGGSALLGSGAAVVPFAGPPRDQYLTIAKRTIETFNAGASLANLGVSEQRADDLARRARPALVDREGGR